MSAPIDQPDWQNPQTGMAVQAGVLDNVLLNPGDDTAPLGVAGYSTMTVQAVAAPSAQVELHVVDLDLGVTVWRIATQADPVTGYLAPFVFPITGQNLVVHNFGGTAVTIFMTVSTRLAVQNTMVGIGSNVLDLSKATGAVSGNFRLGIGYGSGLAQLEFGCGGGVTGALAITQGAVVTRVADTAEGHTNPFGGTEVYKTIVLPKGGWTADFQTGAAGTGNINCKFIFGA